MMMKVGELAKMEQMQEAVFVHCYTKNWAYIQEEYRYVIDSIPGYFFLRCAWVGLSLVIGIVLGLTGWWKCAFVCIAGGSFLIFYSFLRPRQLLRKAFRDAVLLFGANEWEEKMRFGEKIEICSGGKVTAILDWMCCRKIEEDSDWLKICCSGKLNFLLEKEKFTKGTVEEFRSWLKETQPHIIWQRKK